MARHALTEFYGTSDSRKKVGGTIKQYADYYHGTDGEGADRRKSGYANLVNAYYDVATDFYEYGWGQSFHFAPRVKGEKLDASIVRQQHYIAHRLGLAPGMKVLDVGCGVGGPARGIARFCGPEITGLNNNAYQIERGRTHTHKARLEGLCKFVKGDFMQIPMEDASFDAAYAFEATCHAPTRLGVFSEIFRVLKPGALFASQEWCLTDRHDPANAEHRRIKSGIEEGNALPDLVLASEVEEALGSAGFVVEHARDMALDCDAETPWYEPLAASMSLSGFRNTRLGSHVTHGLVRLLEAVRLAPKGATEVSSTLMGAGRSLVKGGQTGTFTPLQIFVARKP